MMKKILSTVLLVLALGCNTKNESTNSLNDKKETETTTSSIKNIKPVNPCELFNAEQLATFFDIADASTIEMYARNQYGTKKQCQFIWPEEKGSVAGSQIMIDITSKTEDMGATFSRMLELDLLNGLSARENGQTIIIKPTLLEGFGEFAYHWEQPGFQNVQKIAFQVRNDYRVDIMYNAYGAINASAAMIKNKLSEIGKQIKQNL